YRMFPHVEGQMDRLKKLPRTYLAYELLTRDWEAFLFGHVASELAEAKARLCRLGLSHRRRRSGEFHRGPTEVFGLPGRCDLARRDARYAARPAVSAR